MDEIELQSKPHLSSDFDNLFQINIPHKATTNNGKYYVHFNRLLFSKRCIYFYLFLISSSITIFAYSILAYFLKLDELPIVICETILIIVITIDMMIRLYVARTLNYIDLFLIVLNFFTIFMYMKFHNTAQEIEDISFALLLFVRNSSQLLRLYVLIKNQQTVSRNVEEIINLNILFEEKKFEILSIKNKKKINHAISFVDEDFNKKKSAFNNYNIINTSMNDEIGGGMDHFEEL